MNTIEECVFFVSPELCSESLPELCSERDYLITHSVRSMYVCMYVCMYYVCMWYFTKLITVYISTYIDVFPWDLDTMILGLSHTFDLNRCEVKGHLGVNNLWFKFLKKGSLYPHTLTYFHGTWTMILGQSYTCDLNRLGVKGHLGVNDLWFKFLKKGSLYPHTLMCFHGTWIQ